MDPVISRCLSSMAGSTACQCPGGAVGASEPGDWTLDGTDVLRPKEVGLVRLGGAQFLPGGLEAAIHNRRPQTNVERECQKRQEGAERDEGRRQEGREGRIPITKAGRA
mmetsp:Transcript_60449/g.128138  ORF Transcript_60449/g.128138 Transcript_60449/m.128138 type:complete len:109 (+) Transcript_60449:1116-1442(+)